MADLYLGKIPIIRRDLNEGFMRGEPAAPFSTGAIPRDFDVDPVRVGDSPAGMKVLADAECLAAYAEQEANESSLMHRYLGDVNNPKPAFEFLDQNGFPDCWAHSTAHALMMARLKMNLPPVRLNAVAVATLLGQTNGGWCGLSAKFAREHGYPEIGTGPGQWPYQSRKGSQTPELTANMALHKSEEDWYNLGKREYDQVLAKQQLKTLGVTDCPVAADWMKFGHSMYFMRAVPLDGDWHPLVLNSWKGFGYYGLAVLYKMWPDNAVGIRTVVASAK